MPGGGCGGVEGGEDVCGGGLAGGLAGGFVPDSRLDLILSFVLVFVLGCGWGLRLVVGLCLLGLGSAELFEEKVGEAAGAVGGLVEVLDGGEVAELGVVDDVVDGVGVGGGGAGEVGAGGLEAVEEEAGAAGVDVVLGDAAEDLADGVLDGAAVFGHGEVEGAAAAAAGGGVVDGAAGGVVVVAEGLLAQGGAAAAAAVGEEVLALEAGWWMCGWCHVWGTPLPLVCGAKSSIGLG